MMEYRWKQGFPSKHVDPQIVGERLEVLRDGGIIEPEHVVNAARSHNDCMHPLFEWEDGLAAHEYRLEQARKLVRSVTVIIMNDADEPKEYRAFVNISTPEQSAYTTIQAAMADPGTREMILKRAWGELAAWKRKYEDLREFAAVFKAMDKVEPKIANG